MMKGIESVEGIQNQMNQVPASNIMISCCTHFSLSHIDPAIGRIPPQLVEDGGIHLLARSQVTTTTFLPNSLATP